LKNDTIGLQLSRSILIIKKLGRIYCKGGIVTG